VAKPHLKSLGRDIMNDGWLSALQVPAELRYGSTEERRKLKWGVDG
jgi:hypothetical protein